MSLYRLKGLIGKGGMGEVYAAERVLPHGVVQPVACKVMTKPGSDALFIREAMVTLTMAHDHPCVVTTFDCLEGKDGALYQIMELVEGCSLALLIDAHGRLTHRMTRLILAPVLAAVAYCHERGFLHRDISPENVLISKHGDVKLSDFGLAKPMKRGRASTTRPVGKIPFLPPEVLGRGMTDPRTDLYALGGMLWEMLCGHPPFGSVDSVSELNRRRRDNARAPLPDDTPVALSMLARGWVRSDPDRRWPDSAQGALEMLERSEIVPEDKAKLGEIAAALWHREQQLRQRSDAQGRPPGLIDAVSIVEGNAASVRLTEQVSEGLEPGEKTDSDSIKARPDDGRGAPADDPGAPPSGDQPGGEQAARQRGKADARRDKTKSVPRALYLNPGDMEALLRQDQDKQRARRVRNRRTRLALAAIAACVLVYFGVQLSSDDGPARVAERAETEPGAAQTVETPPAATPAPIASADPPVAPSAAAVTPAAEAAPSAEAAAPAPEMRQDAAERPQRPAASHRATAGNGHDKRSAGTPRVARRLRQLDHPRGSPPPAPTYTVKWPSAKPGVPFIKPSGQQPTIERAR